MTHSANQYWSVHSPCGPFDRLCRLLLSIKLPPMKHRLGMAVAVISVVVVGACAQRGGPSATAPSVTNVMPATVPTVLILDASGSMNETDAPGPRIDAAKAAAQGLADGLPDDATIGLMTYGTATGSDPSEEAAGCEDVTTLIALGHLDRAQMRTQILSLRASGYTPISLALQTALAQLPMDRSPQAIVLVSDGEDTCGSPPCDTAKQAKQSHPGLTISTVGFKTEGPASEQLSCIAAATGGLFVQAQNASQLSARLLATQNVGAAQSSLSSDGINGITLGSTLGDIRKAHPDFPDASASGPATVVYRDCDFGFVDGVLDSIAPHGGGRTIDGVAPGTPLSRVGELYGPPLQSVTNADGSHTLIYTAEPSTDHAYRIAVDQYNQSGTAISGFVKTIVLCRCGSKPGGQQPTSGRWTEPVIVITPTSLGAVKVGMSVPEAEAAAGKPFDGSGDGAHYPKGSPELYIVPPAPCVGVSGPSTASTTVVTAEGVRLGDSADRIPAVYGGRAQYVPAPNFGRTPAAGYIVGFHDGKLAFVVSQGIVTGIHAGPDVTPSNCGG